MTKRIVLLLAFLFSPFLARASNCDGAANCYVRAAATGSGNGSNWTNACTGFTGACAPPSMTRGVTYWVATGNYNGPVFNTPNSGTTVISITGVTLSSHGPAADWNNAFAGQAVFTGGTDIATDYWIINGQTRGSDWRSGYTLKFVNATDPTYHALGFKQSGSTRTNWTIDYVEMVGTNTVGSTFADEGFECYERCNNLYLGHSYIHHVGSDNISINFGGGGGTTQTFEYNYFEHNHSGQNDFHSQGFQITSSQLIIRYNVFKDIISSGAITTASGGNNIPTTWWEIYGNVFFWSPLLVTGAESAGAFLGNGFVANYSSIFSDHIYIYNNTIANIRPGCGGCAVSGRFWYNVNADPPTLDIRNNLVYNSVAVDNSSTGITMDYNSYYGGTTNSNDTSAHKQTIAVNPFVNVSALNFRLSAPMTGVLAGIPLGPPYNKDMDGNTRGVGTWDRGAYQFSTGTTGPNPPQKLIVVTVQ